MTNTTPPRRLGALALGFVLFLTNAVARKPELAPPPAAVQQLTKKFFALPLYRNVHLAPDGSYVSFLQLSERQHYMLADVELKTGTPHLLAGDTEQDIGDYYWVGNNAILFGMHQGSRGLGYRTTSPLFARTQKVDSEEMFYDVIFASPQDKAGVYLRRVHWDPSYFSPLFRLDVARNSIREVEKNPGRVVGWSIDLAGRARLGAIRGIGDTFSHVYKAPGAQSWEPITMPDRAWPVAYDPTGNSALITYLDADGWEVLQPFDFEKRQLVGQPLRRPGFDIGYEGVELDPRTGAAQMIVIAAEKPEFIWFDQSCKKLVDRLAPTFPGKLVVPLGLASTGEVLILVSSDVSPSEYFLFDPAKSALRPFLDPYPQLRDTPMSPMQPITFAAHDGYTLHGYLVLPVKKSTGKAPPLIVISHGGPHLRDEWSYVAEAQYFAALGYAVLQVNYRGSSGYGQKHRLDTSLTVHQRSVDDVADGIQWAIAQGHADPKRIVVYGASYGGYISLALATRYPDLATCAIGFAGVYDWAAQTKDDMRDFKKFYRERADYYPDVKTHLAEYRAVSPVNFADKVKIPVMLFHGELDGVVDVDQTFAMQTALKKAGKSAITIVEDDVVHGFLTPNSEIKFYEAVTAFLLKYAPPDSAP